MRIDGGGNANVRKSRVLCEEGEYMFDGGGNANVGKGRVLCEEGECM
jgi:hypothetical protein